MDFGKLHVLLVHFPIALALAAALADILWTVRRRDFLRHAAFYCIILAALGAIPTVIAGDALLESMNLTGELHEIAETHEALGITTMCVLCAAAVLRAIRRNQLKGWWLAGYGVLIFAAVVLVSLTGHFGGQIAFGVNYLSGLF